MRAQRAPGGGSWDGGGDDGGGWGGGWGGGGGGWGGGGGGGGGGDNDGGGGSGSGGGRQPGAAHCVHTDTGREDRTAAPDAMGRAAWSPASGHGAGQ